jgi:hypothetical protein
LKKFDFYYKKDNTTTDNVDINNVFGGDDEEIIDE